MSYSAVVVRKKGIANKPVGKVLFHRLMDCIFDMLKLSGVYVGSFISGIKVYAYADEHAPERKMVFPTYFQMLQTIVIEDTVIYPLTGSAFTVNIFILQRIPPYTGLETQVAVVLYVYGAPIAAWGTFGGMRAFLNTAAFQRAAVFMGVFDRVIPPWAHFMARPAKRMAFLAESDAIRGIWGRVCPAVDIDQCIHVPAFQQFISRDVVMCRVKADIFGGKPKNIAPKIINGIQEVFAVVTARAGKLHQQRKFNFQSIVPAA